MKTVRWLKNIFVPAVSYPMFDEAMFAAELALAPKADVPGGTLLAYARKADEQGGTFFAKAVADGVRSYEP